MTKRYSRYGVGGNNGYSCRERFLALGVHSLEEQSRARPVSPDATTRKTRGLILTENTRYV